MGNMEIFPLVDEHGTVVGKATRGECHSGSMLMHPVVHLHVKNNDGAIFLQKRSMHKDIQPGKWDTAVGGHVDYGETIEEALVREAREEIGLIGFDYTKIVSYVFTSKVEKELVNSFYTISMLSQIKIDNDEVDEGKFWSIEEIRNNIGKNIFTPNFEFEFQNYIDNKI